MVRLVVEDRFLHAGWGKFGFVAGEPFDAGGYPANADGNRTAGLFAAVAETPLLPGFADVVVPVGEFLIGLGLTLGALTRPAACSAGS
ncbi:hypothetical protein BRD03_02265 [Halobacteriales archaeon QS_9_68_17]|nr:MAG: hypothetical protein BRD03_02265 [Halobacteriales archaeon QS_9_68_17]